MLAFDTVCTLIRCENTQGADEYICYPMRGCSWYGSEGDTLSNRGETPAAGITVRIPENALYQVIPRAGDFLVRGYVAQLESRKCLSALTYFRVASVTDNRRGTLRHWKVESG